MGDFVFNIAKGRVARYADLPAANDALLLVLLKASGLEGDALLRDYDTLAAVLAGASDECDFTGYARRTLGSVVVTVDDTNDRVDVDAAAPAAYTAVGSGQAAGKAVVCYDPDTTASSDSAIVPLVGLDAAVTFDVGVATTLSFAAAGFARAS